MQIECSRMKVVSHTHKVMGISRLKECTQQHGNIWLPRTIHVYVQFCDYKTGFNPEGHFSQDLCVCTCIDMVDLLKTHNHLWVYRVGCAQRLAKSLPAPYPISPLLAEVLFSQMLMIPQPPLRPVAYGTLMVNLCQVNYNADPKFSI